VKEAVLYTIHTRSFQLSDDFASMTDIQAQIDSMRVIAATINQHITVINESVSGINQELEKWDRHATVIGIHARISTRLHPLDEQKMNLKHVRRSITYEYCAEEDKDRYKVWDSTLTNEERDNLRYWMYKREKVWEEARAYASKRDAYPRLPNISIEKMKSLTVFNDPYAESTML
jgi:uncharacterized coiled-coil DUF342 family protein